MAQYIERTIRSVVGQGYPNLEYIVIDGASTDGTVSIVQQYIDKIDVFVSKPDEGQYHAIQKGLDISQGEILAWLNADDIYYPWTFSVVGEVFAKFPDVDWIIGLPSHISKSGQCVSLSSGPCAYPRKFIRNGWAHGHLGPHLQQESTFWRKTLWDKVGGLDLKWKYAADFELWTRFAQHAEPVAVSIPLAAFRLRPGEQISSADHDSYHEEVRRISERLHPPPWLWNQIAKRSHVLRCLYRLAIWRECRVIAYSEEKGEWVLRTLSRPISQSSLRRLVLDYAVDRT
jgi:GT2 family glycosyltransferase